MARTTATSTPVDRDGLVAFARTRHSVVLTTFRADGGLQSSPVTCGVDAQGPVATGFPARLA